MARATTRFLLILGRSDGPEPLPALQTAAEKARQVIIEPAEFGLNGFVRS
jgi:hypothetical protein